ncbi:MAG TPA: dihydroxy-acid dehydratase, partial [bacterium]|nr:dihydroxy-acid dehydratase [bacterium]
IIVAIKDGDEIIIDIPARKLELNVSDEELKNRMNNIKHPQKKLTGYLRRYANMVTSAATGAVFKDDLLE